MASWGEVIMASWGEKLCTAAEEGNIKDVELSLKNGANLENTSYAYGIKYKWLKIYGDYESNYKRPKIYEDYEKDGVTFNRETLRSAFIGQDIYEECESKLRRLTLMCEWYKRFKDSNGESFEIRLKRKEGEETISRPAYLKRIMKENNEDYHKQLVRKYLFTSDTDSFKDAASGAGLFEPVYLRIPVGHIFDFVSAYVVSPSGKKVYPKIKDNNDGTVTILNQPTETGLHEIHANYNNQKIQGSPFKFHVDAVNSIHVTAYGPGLTHGIVNEPAYFTIVNKDAGAGRLSVFIKGPSKTKIKCRNNGDGSYTIRYVPTATGEYHITVKFAGQNISGSPFTSIITCSAGEIRCKSQFGRSSEYELKAAEVDINNLMATIRTPSGAEERCLLKRLAHDHLGISFTPREVGVHLVYVYGIGNQMQNSPFKITVGENELGNASKVKVLGPGLEKCMANELSEFVVDNKDAEACSPVHLWQTQGYEDRQNQSTVEEDADTFDKHEKKYLHREHTTCEKVCLPMERSNSTINGHIFQSSINLLNFKSKNNDSLFSFGGNCSQSTNEGSYMLWFQFCQCRKSPGILTEVFTQDWKVFRVRTFQNNLLLQTSVELSMHLLNEGFRQSDVEDSCELVVF